MHAMTAKTTRALFASLAVGVSGALLSACERAPAAPSVEDFLRSHWVDPLPPQGRPPAKFTPLEASLAPEACAQCHPEQHAQWRSALHSHAMGPGIRWQFELLGPNETNRCLRCHAPLAEQKALVARAMGWPNAPRTPTPDYVPGDLDQAGLTCAACHVRAHLRYGPPKAATSSEPIPHAGFIASEAFLDSRFCATCHQFPEDGPRLAGKLREDTYRQWQASAYAKDTPCQSCHMPEGKHLWRGVHDPEMLRRALDARLTLTPAPEGRLIAEVVVANRGAGHHLPTYMVPKIDLVLNLHRPGGTPVEIGRDVIGWKADAIITREEFDTRLAAGETRHYRHAFKAPVGKDWHVELRVDVAPREHYERMFKHSLATLSMSETSTTQLQEAIREAEATRYTALRVQVRP